MRFPFRDAMKNLRWLETLKYWDFDENADIKNPPAGTLRLHAEDNGAGKTRLVVRNSAGNTFVIWTEP